MALMKYVSQDLTEQTARSVMAVLLRQVIGCLLLPGSDRNCWRVYVEFEHTSTDRLLKVADQYGVTWSKWVREKPKEG